MCPHGADGPILMTVVWTLLQEHQIVGRGDVRVPPLHLQAALLCRFHSGRLVVGTLEMVACKKESLTFLNFRAQCQSAVSAKGGFKPVGISHDAAT